jgi:hypothetical protein
MTRTSGNTRRQTNHVGSVAVLQLAADHIKVSADREKLGVGELADGSGREGCVDHGQDRLTAIRRVGVLATSQVRTVGSIGDTFIHVDGAERASHGGRASAVELVDAVIAEPAVEARVGGALVDVSRTQRIRIAR